ncbi:hypothetical protein B9Z55_018087 [Caenorhabditis nigoni]|uniref:Glycosyltransferase family 92 protein n=1 Tax=Caenorhabditis nigoni TaxID=1611254 RepID=A0A2G5TCP2_9PELO|nr:hypothetical protein B9Z55_018087 [Caenorhabditis nigoni]
MDEKSNNEQFLTGFLIVIVILVTVIYILPTSNYSTASENLNSNRPLKAFILSAYFYPTSKSLGNNSLALVMSMNLGKWKGNYAPVDTVNDTRIVVMARNETTGTVVSTRYERITPHDNCQMVTVFATVQLLPDPVHIALISNEDSTEIKIKIPSPIKRDVVVCISPLYVTEQWQNFLLAAHTYRRFGAHFHVYFVSAVSSFFQLLYEYDIEGYITLQPWDRVLFPFVPGDIADPYQEIEFQSLAGAQTDCLLQYKESAEFVALFDLNDILIPKSASTLLEEFQHILGNQERVSFLSYTRRNHEINVFNNTEFSIGEMVDSLADRNTTKFSKSVVVTKNLNFTSMDRPYFVPEGFVSLDVVDNSIIHLEEIIWIDRNDTKDLKSHSKESNNSSFSYDALSDIETDLDDMLRTERVAQIIPDLPNFFHFYDLTNKCIQESKSNNPKRCPGPQMCGFYQHPNVNCVHVNARHKPMKTLEPITYYFATDVFYSSDIGCYAH